MERTGGQEPWRKGAGGGGRDGCKWDNFPKRWEPGGIEKHFAIEWDKEERTTTERGRKWE